MISDTTMMRSSDLVFNSISSLTVDTRRYTMNGAFPGEPMASQTSLVPRIFEVRTL